MSRIFHHPSWHDWIPHSDSAFRRPLLWALWSVYLSFGDPLNRHDLRSIAMVWCFLHDTICNDDVMCDRNEIECDRKSKRGERERIILLMDGIYLRRGKKSKVHISQMGFNYHFPIGYEDMSESVRSKLKKKK